jgi:hypothetical protein
MMVSNRDLLPVACNLSALRPNERARREALATQLCAHTQAVIETDHGYAMRLPDNPCAQREAFELALLERRCCPFLQIDLTMKANDGLVWLTFSGGPGVKAFLSASSLFAEWGLERGSSNSDID